ncbi:zinc finger protein ZFMSA12A [Parasteatoda tepidariorum]|uniref:zinc finger protein ZFMSA12A n=1 Tax=Parasteatoda tepidariorum TaxID=114398 RepID=UPI0039BD6DEE
MSTSVLAVYDIPEGTCSLPGVGNINMIRLLEKSTNTTFYHVEVRNGYLSILEKEAGQNWACFVDIARNCYEQNVELIKSHGVLVLRTTRLIKSSEELFVWIGSDLLSELEYPFLKPFNIKGNQDYFCHKCGKKFENPNPLKVHLSLECVSLLQTKPRNVHIEPLSNSLRNFTMKDRQFSVYPECTVSTQTIYNSSFRPKTKISSNIFPPKLSPGCYSASSSNSWIDNPLKSDFQSQGHVCPFCGKVYSRKYGLKIHVRTHTGYKPLKCKFCFRPFSDPSNLNKHVRLHSDSDTPYRCPICGKVLVRRRDLQRHMKSRHQTDSLIDSKEKDSVEATK